MKLAIIASETFNDKKLLLEKIEESQADYLLSGDENNIEKLITEVAESLHLHKHIFSTDVQKHGSEVSVINLKAIINQADYILVFWDGHSKGAMSFKNLANRMNKHCEIVLFE